MFGLEAVEQVAHDDIFAAVAVPGHTKLDNIFSHRFLGGWGFFSGGSFFGWGFFGGGSFFSGSFLNGRSGFFGFCSTATAGDEEEGCQ